MNIYRIELYLKNNKPIAFYTTIKSIYNKKDFINDFIQLRYVECDNNCVIFINDVSRFYIEQIGCE